MSEKLTRKEIKQDDRFHNSLVELSNWVTVHKKRLTTAGVTIVVIILAGFIWSFFSQKRYEESMSAYTKALQESQAEESAFEAQLLEKKKKGEKAPAQLSKDVVIANEIMRLTDVAKKYTRTEAAFYSKFKIAQLYYELGKFHEAQAYYNEIVDSAPNEFTEALVLYGLGYSEESLERYEQASKAFESVVSRDIPFFSASALLGKGRCLEKLNRLDDAKKAYEEVQRRWPNSPLAKTSEQYLSLVGSLPK